MIDPADLQAKSDQLNAIDFTHPITFRIEKVDYNKRQPQPIKMHLEGCKGRPFKPCKSVLRGLCKVWTEDEQSWVGKQITLFCDDSVKWAGEEVGGIRVKAVSGISEPASIRVQLNKKQRTSEIWDVIPDDSEVVEEFIVTHHVDNITKAKSNEKIDGIVLDVKTRFGNDALVELKDAVIAARAKLNGDLEGQK